jgi:tripartite-type tricarboxylate transporter receptor subunit TctC
MKGLLHALRRLTHATYATCLFAGSVQAASTGAVPDYPSRAVRLIAPSPAGGPSDFAARLLAPKLGEYLKQNIVVDNRQSVNGVIATELVAKAPADGLTLGIGNNGTHVINAGLYKNLPYDPLRDFVAVSQLISNGSALAGHIKFAPRTLKELIATAKANPGKINVGVAGANGAVGTEVFKSAMGIVLNNVPYKGSAPAEVAVISGEVELVQLSVPVVAPHYRSGRLKVYAIISSKRSPLLPDVQTFSEQGIAGYETAGNWHGVFVPAKTPDRIVRILHREIVRVFDAPDIKEVVSNRGSELIVNSPEQFAEQLKRDVPRFRKIMLDAGIVPQ